jgi:hypothetical protein
MKTNEGTKLSMSTKLFGLEILFLGNGRCGSELAVLLRSHILTAFRKQTFPD